jgi:anti-sigma factor ChrR (cupin superfamily)
VSPTDQDPKDIDARLGAESQRLLSEMNQLIERSRLLLRDRQLALSKVAAIPQPAPGTLGAVLYARPQQAVAPERDWVSLVRSIAAKDELALHALYERVRDPVRTLVSLLSGEEAAERLAADVLLDVWREAERYDAANGLVLAWVMNLARARAIAGPRSFVPGTPRVALPRRPQWIEPAWEAVAPGITVKMLAADTDKHMIGMLVRLVPGGAYPAHEHAGAEELHLLEGELWIDEHKLHPGDYNRAEPGTGDKRVWSETGCACVLITSTRDILR